MKVSLNIVKKYTSVDLPTDELVKVIGAQLGAVEEVIKLGPRYAEALIVKVIDVAAHPGADRVRVCRIDDGKVTEAIERDSDGYIQVVCGAPNVEANFLAVWLPSGSTVPASVGKDPLVLTDRDIRGVISHGMLASAKELAIGDNHEGILAVDKNVTPGTPFSEVYDLDDTIIDIENKMFTHRPDCFGQLGVAREIAGITNKSFSSPQWYLGPDNDYPNTDDLKLEVKNEIPDLVPRLSVQIIRDIEIKPSSVQIQSYLSRLGVRPINNVVDQTNYFMLLIGQPLHAYDYDKVLSLDSGADHATLMARHPTEGESLTLLNGKTIKPSPKAILIATATKAIGLGGVMGGEETEVDNSTKNIILECANFDMYSIRRASMANGIFTDAVTRFNKGQSPLQTDIILNEITNYIIHEAGGSRAGHFDEHGKLKEPDEVRLSPDFINSRLGLSISAGEVVNLLKNVEFKVEEDGEFIKVKAPFWRTDIAIPEDVVEEVGRLKGYSSLPQELPRREIKPSTQDPMLDLKQKIRSILSKGGANELLTYSFVNGQLIDKAGQDKSNAFQIANALSPDLQYYRLSLLPSLLEKVHANIKNGYGEFCLFEMNKVHAKDASDELESDVPAEQYHLALVYVIDDKLVDAKLTGAPYYQAKYYLEYLLNELDLEYEIKPYENEPSLVTDTETLKSFEPIRTGLIVVSGQVIGAIGEPKPSIKRNLKLPKFSAMLELDLKATLSLLGADTSYRKLSSYPRVEQDICFKVSIDLRYQELKSLLNEELKAVSGDSAIFSINPVDIYKREDDPNHKQITFHITLNSYEKTLTSAEANQTLVRLGEVAAAKFQAEVI
jgi:phenylalanyl-tRNA synthetase beta chain